MTKEELTMAEATIKMYEDLHYANLRKALPPDYEIHLNKFAQVLAEKVREAERSEIIKMIEEMRPELDNPEISYGQDVDITELPEGLIAEMTGIKKGYKLGIETALSIIRGDDVCDKHRKPDCMECFYTTSPQIPEIDKE